MSSPKTKDVGDWRWAFLTFICIRRMLKMKMNNRTIFYVDLLAMLLTGLSAARALAQDISGAIVGL
jgi:hypothetical protein